MINKLASAASLLNKTSSFTETLDVAKFWYYKVGTEP
jgi:hypothetical protein